MTVSIGTVRSAQGASKYFAADNNYTSAQAEANSQWAGLGADHAGLSGKVETAAFENVLNGKLPDGSHIGETDKRDHGRDFTFSMPKSTSLLALVSGDKRILQAHVEAVKETMAWAEMNLAEARIKRNGKAVPVATGNLIYAMFQHDTSRSADPQSHIHVVIANVTRLKSEHRNRDRVDPQTGLPLVDQGWRAWHNRKFYDAATTLSSMANALFREKIEQLGYRTELAPGTKVGAFEALGPQGERINPDAIERFSKRRLAIQEKADELNISSAEGRREITRRSRQAKRDPGDRVALTERWREEAHGYSYNGDAIYKAALKVSERGNHVRSPHLIERQIAKMFDAMSARARPDDPLVDKRRSRLLNPSVANTQIAAASAVRILAEREAIFGKLEAIKTALDLGLKGVTHRTLEERFDQLEKNGHLVPANAARSTIGSYTTPDALSQEARILSAMVAGEGQGRALMPANEAKERLQKLAGDRPLNSEQLAAALQIVSSQNRIVLVQGRAGSGKSTMLQPVAKAEALDAAARLLGSSDERAVLLTPDMKGGAKALAFQNKMVADLKADTGLDAMTVHSFLQRYERHLSADTRTGDFEQRKSELAGTYVILDEASMISNEQMDKLTAIANLLNVGRLAIIGDRKQLNPIESGKPFSLMQAKAAGSRFPVYEVNINMRQRTEEMRLVAYLADAGNIKAAMEVLGDRVIESKGLPNTDRFQEAAKAWLGLSFEERGRTTLLPSSREGRAVVNATIQDGLKAEGTLKGDGREFAVRERVDISHEQMRFAHLWHGASHLEVKDRRNSLGLARGDYEIRDIQKNGKVKLRGANGQNIKVDPFRIDPARRGDGVRLTSEKTVRLHEGERIRWTDSDKRVGRNMLNSSIAHVEKVTDRSLIVRLNTGELRELADGDPMLKHMDLAYAINTHMAQGITNAVVFAVMGSGEKHLSNARTFLVNLTRQQENIKIFTDDRERLTAQLVSNRGEKSSALEGIGEVAVESLLRRMAEANLSRGHAAVTSDIGFTYRQDVGREVLADVGLDADRALSRKPDSSPTKPSPAETSIQPQSRLNDRSRELDL